MKLAYAGYWLTLALTAALLAGCEHRVSYVVKNGGNQTLNDVIMKSDSGFAFEHGVLKKGTHSSFSGTMKLKEENELTISWNRSGGTPEERTLVVPSKVLKDERMRVFTITQTMEIEESWRWED